MNAPFFQEPPTFANTYSCDQALRSYLTRALPGDQLREIEPELVAMGELVSDRLLKLQVQHRDSEPRLVQWDAWGKRIDRIELTPVWEEAARIAAERGVVATAYERKHGANSRVHQFALAYLFGPPTETYSCPLAMSDGAAKTILMHGDRALVERTVPRLMSRDPARVWTSGQWMTERTGGSDVVGSETIARWDGDTWRLFGTKWFASATTSEVALILARPEGDRTQARRLGLFYVEPRDEEGRFRNIFVNRLKAKLGTRMLPTAELTLDGTPAAPLGDLANGVKHIAPMLNITRTWNAVGAAAGMRWGLTLARDYARKRRAFGAPLSQQPLHVQTLADLEAECQAALLLAFRVVELLGLEEAGEISGSDADLLRILTPVAKATTAKQAVTVASEALECFGGAGYVEDTGLPRLLRDSQVLPIWEGTTNILSLDVMRALQKIGSLGPIEREVLRRVKGAPNRECARAGAAALAAVAHAGHWLTEAVAQGAPAVQAGARRFTLTIGRAVELALLVDHAAWAAQRGDPRPSAAARHFVRLGVDFIADEDCVDTARTLLG